MLENLARYRRELESLAGELTAMSDRLRTIADGLARGIPPPDDLSLAIRSTRERFLSLQDNLEAVAASDLPEAGVGHTSLDDLEHLLDQAVRRHVGRIAGAVLQPVHRLVHEREATYPPLLACQEQGRHLADRLAQTRAISSYELADMLTPYEALLGLVRSTTPGASELDDDLWAILQAQVAAAFGQPLAVAAARGRLRISAVAPVPEPTAPSGGLAVETVPLDGMVSSPPDVPATERTHPGNPGQAGKAWHWEPLVTIATVQITPEKVRSYPWSEISFRDPSTTPSWAFLPRTWAQNVEIYCNRC